MSDISDRDHRDFYARYGGIYHIRESQKLNVKCDKLKVFSNAALARRQQPKGTIMQPLILRGTARAEHVPWRDAPTDTDPLPAMVATDANGLTSLTTTRATKVAQETTDDK
jgi:hypothetical protein